MSKFRAPDRQTNFLLPPSVEDWLPPRHLARFIADAVAELNLGAIEREYAGCGSKPYHPGMLIGLLVYGYATGIFSSRKLEQATYELIPVRFLCGNLHPDHDTIAAFRRRFLPHLESLFDQILRMAYRMKLLKLGAVSLDGTKVKANASKHKALSWDRAISLEEQFREEARRLLRMAEEADAQEAEEDLDIPEELAHRETRLKKIREAAAEIKQRSEERHRQELAEYEAKLAERAARKATTGKNPRGAAPKPPEEGPRPKDQVNLTDKESRIMPSKGGFEQAYNAQLAVDLESGIILTKHVTNRPVDVEQLEPTVAKLKALPPEIGRVDALLADAGYFSRSNVELCEAHAVIPHIASDRTKHNRTLDERLASRTADPPACDGNDLVAAMRHRMQTKEGRNLYARRKSTVEPTFGVIKHVLGFRQFLLRGLENVQGEWNLVCMAMNLKRMHALTV